MAADSGQMDLGQEVWDVRLSSLQLPPETVQPTPNHEGRSFTLDDSSESGVRPLVSYPAAARLVGFGHLAKEGLGTQQHIAVGLLRKPT